MKVCEEELKQVHGDVLILAGDVPLIRGQVLKTLLSNHREEKVAASMATAMLDDPTGYGRVVRDANGEFERIVEQVDATEEQREIREVFPSYYCVKVDELLWRWVSSRTTTRRVSFISPISMGILRKAGKQVLAVQAVTAEDVIAPNSRAELAVADAVMQERIQRQHRDNGVTIVSGINTYLEDGVTIGADTTIHPFSYIGREATIGAECVIGPFAVVPREAMVREGSSVSGISSAVGIEVVYAIRLGQAEGLRGSCQSGVGAGHLQLSSDPAGARPHRAVPRRRGDGEGGGRRAAGATASSCSPPAIR